MKTKKFISLITVALSLIACNKNVIDKNNKVIEPSGEGMMFLEITVTSNDNAKANVTNDMTVIWEDNDHIAIFDGEGKRDFTLTSKDGNKATFKGEVSETATELYAVYPFSAADRLNENKSIRISVPGIQKAASGKADPAALVAVAKASVSSPSFKFKNVVAIAKLEIKHNAVNSLSFKGNVPVQLCGAADVDLAGEAPSVTPVIETAEDYSITLLPQSGEFEKTVHCIAVLPSTMGKGPCVTLTTSTGKIAEKTSENKLTLARGTASDLHSIGDGLIWKNDGRLTGNSIKLLCIGNSFSEDACEHEEMYLYDLFKAGGITPVIGNAYKGSCDLATHWSMANSNTAGYSYRKTKNGTRTTTASQALKTILSDENWDYILVQQGGGNQGFYNTYEPYLGNLIQYCRDNSAKKDFKLIFHYNWAAAKDYTGEKFGKYDYDQMKMYNMQATACQQADAVTGFDLVANTGDAIQNGRTTYLGDTWNRDGWHLKKTYGRYCAACLVYERITGKSCIGTKSYPSTITDGIAFTCQNCAHTAALYKYQIADMSWIPNTDPEPVDDFKVLAKWLFDKTVSKADGHQKSWTGENVALGQQATSNAPGLVGYMDANMAGSGRISFYQIDKSSMTEEKAARYILNGTPGGQPAVCGQMGGDYWIIENTGESFSEGDHLVANFTIHPSKYGAKYWMLEYLDGTQWKPVYSVKHIDIKKTGIDVNEFDYNVSLSTNTKYDCTVDVVLTEPTEAFRIRLTCCSTYQVNDKWWTHPRNASEFRIAGTEADNNLPIMKLMYK